MDKVWSQTEACYLSVPANMLWRVTAPLVSPGGEVTGQGAIKVAN